jgi:hypothetical protein
MQIILTNKRLSVFRSVLWTAGYLKRHYCKLSFRSISIDYIGNTIASSAITDIKTCTSERTSELASYNLKTCKIDMSNVSRHDLQSSKDYGTVKQRHQIARKFKQSYTHSATTLLQCNYTFCSAITDDIG